MLCTIHLLAIIILYLPNAIFVYHFHYHLHITLVDIAEHRQSYIPP